MTFIYYFTGTGNSLKIAVDMASGLGDAELVSIPQVIDNDEIFSPADTVGIIFPVYCFGIPPIVADFIKKLKVKSSSYVFILANHGRTPGPGGTVLQARNLAGTCGINLNAIFIVRMVGNYTPLFGLPEAGKQKKILDMAEEEVNTIIGMVKNKEFHIPSGFIMDLFRLFMAFLNRLIVPITPNEDKNFYVNDNCNGCGVCERLCPVSNIEISNGRPVWLHHCQQCISCFSLCPSGAIQIGKRNKKSARYKNPGISVEDIIRANGRQSGADNGSCHRR